MTEKAVHKTFKLESKRDEGVLDTLQKFYLAPAFFFIAFLYLLSNCSPSEM